MQASFRACSFAVLIGFLLTLTAMPKAAADSLEATRVFELASTVDHHGVVYQYEVEFDLEGQRLSGVVNPSAEEGKRFVVSAPAQQQWSEEIREKVSSVEKNSSESMWCQGLLDDAKGFTDAVAVDEGFTYTLIMDVDDDKKEEVKFARHVVSKVTLSSTDGAVLSYSMHAPKPFRPVVVAKIKTFDLDIKCARAPDGRTYAQSMKTHVEGRAMMKSFGQKETRTITNLEKL